MADVSRWQLLDTKFVMCLSVFCEVKSRMTSWRQFLCDVRISCQCEMTDRPDTTNKLNIFFCHSSCTSYDDTETEVTDRQDTTKNIKIIFLVVSCELQIISQSSPLSCLLMPWSPCWSIWIMGASRDPL